jgi:hypothetical protein
MKWKGECIDALRTAQHDRAATSPTLEERVVALERAVATLAMCKLKTVIVSEAQPSRDGIDSLLDVIVAASRELS